MSNQIRGLTKEGIWEEVLLGVQEKVKPGIYYISEFYIEESILGSQETVEGKSRGDLGVEAHLQPLFETTTGQLNHFRGHMQVTVDLYDVSGKLYTKTVPIFVEVEGTDDIGETLTEYVEEAYQEFREYGNHKLYTGNRGDYTEVAYGTYLYHDYTFLTDKDTFLKLLLHTYKDSYEEIREKPTAKQLARIHRDIKLHSNREGNITVLGVDIKSTSRPNVMEKDTVFLTLKYTYTLDFEGKFPSDVTITKVGIYNGLPYNLGDSFREYVRGYKGSLETIAASEGVGVFLTVGENKVRYGQMKIRNELPHFNKVNYRKRRTILFNSEESFKRYQRDVTRYIEEQHVKYNQDPRYISAYTRFKEATMESQQFNKAYNDIQGNLTIILPNNYLLHIGTHYAVLDNQLGTFKILYNLLDERISILEAKERVLKYGVPIQTYVDKVLDIIDGRRTIEGPELDAVFGGRR